MEELGPRELIAGRCTPFFSPFAVCEFDDPDDVKRRYRCDPGYKCVNIGRTNADAVCV